MSKPTLYTFGMSVWAAAPELAIADLGYPADAIDVKVVNLAEGANFAPEFLKLNPAATLPTLVADGQAYTSTKDVVHFLVEHAPRAGVARGTAFVDMIHEDRYDPNAPFVLPRNDEELRAFAAGFPSVFLQNRQDALERHAAHPDAAAFRAFYDAKKAANGGLLAVYKGAAPDAAKRAVFADAAARWETIGAFVAHDLPAALPESGFLGGAAPGEDDFHLGAWLARVVFLAGGKGDKEGYRALERETKGPMPAKVAAYWAAWVERPSFQKVYEKGLH